MDNDWTEKPEGLGQKAISVNSTDKYVLPCGSIQASAVQRPLTNQLSYGTVTYLKIISYYFQVPLIGLLILGET